MRTDTIKTVTQNLLQNFVDAEDRETSFEYYTNNSCYALETVEYPTGVISEYQCVVAATSDPTVPNAISSRVDKIVNVPYNQKTYNFDLDTYENTVTDDIGNKSVYSFSYEGLSNVTHYVDETKYKELIYGYQNVGSNDEPHYRQSQKPDNRHLAVIFPRN